MEAHGALTPPAAPRPLEGRALAAGALALAAGALVYLVRPDAPRVVGWLGLSRAFGAASRSLAASGVARAVPEVVRAHGSDAAFALAVALLLRGLWGARSPVHALGLALVLGHEALQGLGVADGTFDLADAAVMLVAYGLGVLVPLGGSVT